MNPKEQEFEIAKEQIKAFHAIETWGLSLFIAGIGLITRQLFQWNLEGHLSCQCSGMVPTLLGIYGSFVVFNANKQNREVRAKFTDSVDDKIELRARPGPLAKLLIAMPVVFGIACSFFLLHG
ncbi:MAG: hypothetical protein HY043_23665 [Verrucomicrobia bacterium]|nr:hypothetical protein [Verrucomicrobiota bacterium]